MKPFKPELYVGKVFHKRFLPKEHAFLYHTFFIKISLFNLEKSTNTFFSINGFNLFSFNFKDHGDRDGSSLLKFAEKKLNEEGVNLEYDDILIHTYPRILGFVFNPVSFWYFTFEDKVVAILAEVNNTFGETKSYLLLRDQFVCEKKMQVSPFNQIEGEYSFDFKHSDNLEKVEIRYTIKDKLILLASIAGKKKKFAWWSFLYLFLSNPFNNICTMIFIHFEALRLYLKKIPFYGKDGAIYDK